MSMGPTAVAAVATMVQSMAKQRALEAKRRNEAFVLDIQCGFSTGVKSVKLQQFCNYCREHSHGELCKQCGAPRD